MAHVDPTASQLKARFPAFSAVPDETVNQAIAEAKRSVDDTWTEGDYTLAIMLAACHIMARDGLGTSPEAKAFATGTGEFQTIRSGALTLTRGNWSGTTMSSYWGSTSWGRRFWRMLELNKPGPRVTNGACGAPVTGYAKDAWTPWGRF